MVRVLKWVALYSALGLMNTLFGIGSVYSWIFTIVIITVIIIILEITEDKL